MASSSGKADDVESSDGKTSVFEYRGLQDIQKEIQETYIADDRPWVIGYSGGKDSTTVLQLIWYAVKDLPDEKQTNPIYVISSDTLVETPKIVNHITSTLENINEYAEKEDLPFEAQKVYPDVSDSFWVNLLGRGYPAPNQNFRWCTDRLKIDPADQFIRDKVSDHGEVIVVLGARKAESATREQVMNLHSIEGSNLSRHSKFASAYVYTPIEDWLVDDVWTYLLQNECPWGKNNRDLAALYQEADDECPMVIDTNTPSCGNSRFGCWTCTVVSEDKAMENMVDGGEDWMKPLLDYRNLLKETQDPDKKPMYREMKGRKHGYIREKNNGGTGVIPRAYKLEFRKHLLRKLLETQKQVNELRGDEMDYLELIQEEELREIRRLWRQEEADWEDSVPRIYNEVMDDELEWTKDDLGTFTEEEAAVLEDVCEAHDIPPKLIKRLLDTELQHHGMKRRAAIYDKIDKIFREDWRSIQEVAAEIDGEEPERWEYDLEYEDLA
ncbi:DNA phosphorothioation system sulfurtransferase DndC [Haloterrigena alkaliphila]|uniref:DNA phosphorothioation system sulfurtransferase DndC n=1 Tax=Haloterrigena alkaliphila TaxID=2816475 RepID=A0A8A2VKX7_9EURY|nr:DNA phosphorothioation system sulfurtransferase DndC [Haloterrigena alkaliphila]QSX01166.1 DNA phosphorothioation system sulfurtransferase DndC [Haloterrigena alkaliphila]